MQKFKDSTGEEWKVVINMGNLDVIEDETGVDLLMLDRHFLTPQEDADPTKRKWLDENGDPMVLAARLQVDDRLLYALIYASCMTHEDNDRQISPVEFAERVSANYQEVETAFFTELGNFYLSLGKPVFKKMLDQACAIFAKMFSKQAETFDQMDPDRVVTEAMQSAEGKSGGKRIRTKRSGRSSSDVENSGRSGASSDATSGHSLRVSSSG